MGKRWVRAGLRVDHTPHDLCPENKDTHEGFQQRREDITCSSRPGRVIQREKVARLEAKSMGLG